MTYRAKPEFANNFSYLLQLLACVLNDTDPPKPTRDTDWASVFSMAELHSVAGMASYAVMRLDISDRPSGEIFDSFISAQREQIVREANIQFETDSLLREFSCRHIPLLPVKGIILKNDYPEPSMRTMTDVDILYREQDRQQVIEVFKAFGYRLTHEVDRQLDFVKEPFHHYELHSKLLPPSKISHNYFADTWSKVTFTDNSFVGSLSTNDIYIYLLEHLAKHLENGGAGLRMIMDVYVFNNAHRGELDEDYLSDELQKLKLKEFRTVIEELAENWFCGSVPDTDSVIADYILCSCTFGTTQNAIMQTAIREEHKSGKKHSGIYKVFRKIFPTYSHICTRFDSAKRFKLLYPFYIPAYWCLRLFRDRNVTTENISHYFKSTDSDTAERIRSVMSELGLSSRM